MQMLFYIIIKADFKSLLSLMLQVHDNLSDFYICIHP